MPKSLNSIGAITATEDDLSTFNGAASFPLHHRAMRLAFSIAWLLLARWNPPPILKKWRILILRIFGAKIDWTSNVYPSAKVWFPKNLRLDSHATIGPHVNVYCMSNISIGSYTVVSQGAFLCTGTHKTGRAEFQICAYPINIGKNAWICADAFVGPGVNIGDGSILSARAVAFCDIPEWEIHRGNPATYLKGRTKFDRIRAPTSAKP